MICNRNLKPFRTIAYIIDFNFTTNYRPGGQAI